MKRILIIDDDPIATSIYRRKLSFEGYKVEAAPDGKVGVDMIRYRKPDLVILDLVLPELGGLEVLEQVRKQYTQKELPIVVFTNFHMDETVKAASQAGANEVLSKTNYTPKSISLLVKSYLVGPAETLATDPAQPETAPAPATGPVVSRAPAARMDDAELQASVRKLCLDAAPKTMIEVRETFQEFMDNCYHIAQLEELYQKVRSITGNTGLAGLQLVTRFSAAFEAFLLQLTDRPEGFNGSTLRTMRQAIEFLGELFDRIQRGAAADPARAVVLIVEAQDDLSKAIRAALEIAELRSVLVHDAANGLATLANNRLELVFIDVELTSQAGAEFCAKLRAMPQHVRTPVVFAAAVSKFEGTLIEDPGEWTDQIAKPFLNIELTVKSLIHVTRSQWAALS